jgi:hypothetical protein
MKITLYLRSLYVMGACAILLLTGCGVSNNFTFTTQPGACPEGNNNAPYCMSVTITNGGGGAQNIINSTSFPISNFVVNVTGASNIQTPSNNTATMDPNECTTKEIKPGSDCTFFLKINNEAYPTTTTETITINMTYTVKNDLFGGGGSTYSNSLTIYQVTNLYIIQKNGYLITANAAQTNTRLIESTDVPNSSAIDTNSFGFLYIGGNNGIYQYGDQSTSKSIATSTQGGGVSNLFTFSTNLYAAGLTTSPPVWIYSLAGESWSSTTYSPSTTSLIPNANTVEPDGNAFYLANANQVISCQLGGTDTSCEQEGANLPGVQTLAFTQVESGLYTGLYAGTSGTVGPSFGLFVESGVRGTTTAQWIQVTISGGGFVPNTLSSTVSNGNLYAGDISGNIWFINSSSSTPNIATQFLSGSAVGDGAITNMLVDNLASILYFIVQQPSATTPGTFTYALYSCSTATASSCPATLIQAPNTFPAISSQVVGLNIGSQLVSSLSSQPN